MTRHTKGIRDLIVAFVDEYRDEHGYSPSVRDLSVKFGVAGSGIHQHLNVLAAEGRIRRTPGVARSIVVLPKVA